MMDKVLLTLMVADLVYFGTGGVLLGFAVQTRHEMDQGPTSANVARNLLLLHTPWTGAIVNAVLVIVSVVVSVPAMALPTHRGWLKAFGLLTVLSTLFTLVLGLDIWFSTLKTRSSLHLVWAQESAQTQSLLQRRFDCCGYVDAATPPFRQDSSCPNALVAAQKPGCVSPFGDYANGFLDLVFTAILGMVALEVIILTVAALLKDRLEKGRFHLSDLKHGLPGI